MEAGEEVAARREALVGALRVAVEVGLPEGCVAELEEIVLGECFDAFRRALTGETPARVAPMRVTLKQGADLSQVKAKPRVYPPEKSAWLKEHFELLCETGMVYPNPQAICASVAMAFPKGPGKGYRLVADFSPINGQCELVPGPMRNPEIEGEKCVGAVAFCTMDCLQGYWQCPLAEEAREYFTFVTKDGLFTPTRVPQGVMNATSYFQGMMMEVLGNLVGRACLIYVDDVKVIGRSVEELIVNLRAVLLRCMERGLFLAAHKLVLFAKEVKLCGKLYSGTTVRHDPERVRGLVEMRRPETVGELMKFLQATNWMCLSLPHMAEVVAPLRALMEHRLKGTSRTKRIASRRALMDGDWTPKRVEAWDNSREMLMNAVALSFRRPDDCRALMFPDASDLFWGCCYKHVLVLMDDVSRFVWLEEAVSCSMEVAARSVLKWCASFGVPKAFTSDGGTHFTEQVMQMVSSRLGVVHHFGVANVSWSHGTVERMNREVVRTFRAVLSERRRPPSEWPLALGAVQWALNSAYRERMGTTPFQMMAGRPPATPMSVLAGKDGDAWTVEELDVSCEQMQSWVAGWVREQEDLRRDVVKRVREQRERVREVSGRGYLPVFEVGDYVLVARVRKPGRVPKLVQTWTGPWRVVSGGSEHVRVVEDIVTGETKEVHVVRMRPYADSSLVVGAEVREVFEMTKHQGEFEIADVISVGKDPARVGEYRVQIAWVGLEDEEPTWEPMSTVYADAPKYLEQKLRRMRLNSVTKHALKRKYDMNL